MRRPFLAYLLAVLVPAALTAAVGVGLAVGLGRELARESQVRVGHMALRALEDDLAAESPPSTAQVGRVTGFRTSLLRDGISVVSTEPPPPPEGVDGSVLVTAGAPAEGTLSYAVLVAPAEAPQGPIPIPLLLVTGLLFVFASLAGWIVLTGQPGEQGALRVVLLSALPALTAWGFLIQADRYVRATSDLAERRDLTRALAVSRLCDVVGDPARVHELTGFHAWKVEGGTVSATSLQGRPDAVAALRAPPPSFTSTGTVDTPAGPAPYAALRLPDGGFAVVAAAPPAGHAGRFSRNAAWAAGALAAWLLLAAAAAAAAKLRISSGR